MSSLPLSPELRPAPLSAVLAGFSWRGRPQPECEAGRSSGPGGAAAAASGSGPNFCRADSSSGAEPHAPTSAARSLSLPSPLSIPPSCAAEVLRSDRELHCGWCVGEEEGEEVSVAVLNRMQTPRLPQDGSALADFPGWKNSGL
ncbi:hypothetical protein P7K49_037188 [Saguinus oedipus]|uniref:Uncharacterized protein n=1 Tax=Saguinus oedipus TaxID=9490 RepID=A0ABQ9THA4_SAGOE|nr:hypothetical protein P7K49_037188 [Saguinus oedipus]